MDRRYTPRGTTYKPCPGCGGEENRPMHGVCGSCRGIIDAAKDRATHAASRDRELALVQAQQRAYALPYLRYGDDEEVAKRVKEGFWRLSMLLSEPTERSAKEMQLIWPYEKSSYGDWRVIREMERDIAETLTPLYAAVRELGDACYQDGHRYGRNLLAQLAGGEITSDQFNDTALRREGKA